MERQFEIIGEALSQLSRQSPQVCEAISGYKQAIAFRNVLIHGYADIDNEVVWSVLQHDLIALADDVGNLMHNHG